MDLPTQKISIAPFTPITMFSTVFLLITSLANLPVAQSGAEFDNLERNFILGDTQPILCSNHVPCYYTAPPLAVYRAHQYGRVQFGQFGCACTEGICQLDYQLDGYPRRDTCVYCGLECYSLGIYAILSGGTTPPPPPTSPLEPIDNDINNNFGQPSSRFTTDNPDQTLEVDRRELPDDTTDQAKTRHPYTESPTKVTLGGIISTAYTEPPTSVTQQPVAITNIPFPDENSTIGGSGTSETDQPITTEDSANTAEPQQSTTPPVPPSEQTSSQVFEVVTGESVTNQSPLSSDGVTDPSNVTSESATDIPGGLDSNSTNLPHTPEAFTTISSLQTEEFTRGLPPGSPSPQEGFTELPIDSSTTPPESTNATGSPPLEFTSEPNLTGSSDNMFGTAESEGAFATEEPTTLAEQNLNTTTEQPWNTTENTAEEITTVLPVVIQTEQFPDFNETEEPINAAGTPSDVTSEPSATNEQLLTTINLPTNVTQEPQEGGTNDPTTDTSQQPVDQSTPAPSVGTDAPINPTDSEQLLTTPKFIATDQPALVSEDPFGIDLATGGPLIGGGGDNEFVSDKVAEFTLSPPTEHGIVDPFATDVPSLKTDFPDMGGDIDNIGDNSESDLSINQPIDESIGNQIDEFATEGPIATDFPNMGGDIDDIDIGDDLSDTGAKAGTNMQLDNEDFDFSSSIDMRPGTDAPPIDYEALDNIELFGNRDSKSS